MPDPQQLFSDDLNALIAAHDAYSAALADANDASANLSAAQAQAADMIKTAQDSAAAMVADAQQKATDTAKRASDLHDAVNAAKAKLTADAAAIDP